MSLPSAYLVCGERERERECVLEEMRVCSGGEVEWWCGGVLTVIPAPLQHWSTTCQAPVSPHNYQP